MPELRIAVAGATGTVGGHVVTALEDAGHRVVPLSRSRGTDVNTGAGLTDALAGVDVVVDVLNGPGTSARATTEFFTATTGRLARAEQDAGVGHHVLLSIVGIDAAPYGYFAGKVAQERLVEAGPVPWTVLRATQFHEFAEQTLSATSGPIAPIPRAAVRPVAAQEVGRALAALAAAPPRGRAQDLRGPRGEQLVDMARLVVAARHERRRVVGLPMPGRYGRALRSGLLRGDPGDRETTTTFRERLTDRYRV